MRRAELLLLAPLCLVSCEEGAPAPPYQPVRAADGQRAYAHVAALVALGERPPGSPALERSRNLIRSHLEALGLTVQGDAFTAQAPHGPVPMENLITLVPKAADASPSAAPLAIAAHIDTKVFEGFTFVGANDGASGAGLLMEIATVLASQAPPQDVYLVFLDGEEAFVEWSPTDGLYGSRHLAAKWTRTGLASRLAAFLVLDMVGDRDLQIARETRSTPWVLDILGSSAARLGWGAHWFHQAQTVDDDHMPFLDAGVPAADIIDFSFGPTGGTWDRRYWHTAMDTLDKVSPVSLQIVGTTVLDALVDFADR